jgi:hypothetical protein
MNKFENSQAQPKDTVEEAKEIKQKLDLLLNNPEENKEEILVLTKALEKLTNILEEEIKKDLDTTLPFYEENFEEIKLITSSFLLKELSEYTSEDIRTRVAENPNTSKETLEKLSKKN